MKDDKKRSLVDQQSSNILTQGVSRRQVLRGMVTSGVVAAGSGLLTPGSSLAYANTDEPKYGGNIKVATQSGSTSDTLDPAHGSGSSDYTRQYMFYNGLTVLDRTLTPQMELAESFETKDAQYWVIKLRKDVLFHDGKPFTSADVLFTLNRHKDPKTSSKVAAVAKQMVEITAKGPHEVHITLAEKNADLPAILGVVHFLIVRDGTTNFDKGNGTGPFLCTVFQPGVHSIATRNPNYWKKGLPYLDTVELFSIPDQSARVNALLAGDVQLINSVNPRAIDTLNASPLVKVYHADSGGYTDLIMRDQLGPMKNPDFVKGMKYIMNREQILNVACRGFGRIGNDQPIPKGQRYYDSALPQTTYDPDKAKYHFKKAGVLGSSIPMVASSAADNSVEMAQLIQLTAQEVGLNLQVKRVPADGYWSNHWMKDTLGFGNINPRPTADLMFTLFFQSNAAWNESGWKNAHFDKLLVAARGETDDAKRKQMYGEMETLIHDQSGIGIPIFSSINDAASRKIGGYKPHPLGGLMAYMFAEHVWLEA
ncbi:ABC transporter substrate-binding protein [Marinomonas spartinae]|uniref:ABC transporter substrate-binding protein n=1 Tax=Marinomonas spartinae TaxID=1792290 RepID=UPI0018F1C65A|nr:ABC transporter substrate-binding protein [Marinomonas spartinae]MBJ7556878.1 ABC transporter substrate-binding protein [Marinomonas spartinae]